MWEIILILSLTILIVGVMVVGLLILTKICWD